MIFASRAPPPRDHPFGLAGYPKAVFILVVVLRNTRVIRWSEDTGCQYGDFLILGQQIHGSQGSLRSNGTSNNEIRLVLQDELFHHQECFTYRHPWFEVPGVNDHHFKWTLYTFDVNPALRIDLLYGQSHSLFGIPPI